MANDHMEAMGRLVQRLRKSAEMTQEELGVMAGYGAGAAVSISRFENGLLTPGPKKLQRIAEVFEMGSDQLEREAAKESERTPTAKGSERLKDRGRRIDREVAERKEALTRANTSFKIAQERVTGNFLTRLSEIGEGIEGARPLYVPQSPGSGSKSGVEPKEGTSESTEVVSGALVDGAALGLVLALLKTARILPVGGIAVPAIAAVAQMAFSGFITAQRQQQERTRAIDSAERGLVETQSSYQALMRLLPQATEILDYIAVHAGHALERWSARLGVPRPVWTDLNHDSRERFGDFLEISGAAMNILTIDFDALAKVRTGDDLSERISTIDDLLTRSRSIVTSKV